MPNDSDVTRFLQAIFPDHEKHALFATEHKGVPDSWKEFRDVGQLDGARDCYLSNGILPDDGIAKRKGRVQEVWALVIDDIGTTGPAEADVERVLGPPTAEVPSSKGNAQWWYVLAKRMPADDWPAFFAEIERLLGTKLEGGEAGHVFRVPIGLNTKTERKKKPVPVEEQNWPVRLGRFNPAVRLDAAGIMLFAEPTPKITIQHPDAKCKNMKWLGFLAPNNEKYDDRKSWVDQAHRFKALARCEQDGFDGFVVWSKKHASNNEQETKAVWDGLSEITGTDGYLLIAAAREAAPDWMDVWWQGQAAEYFNDGVEAPPLAELKASQTKIAPQILTSGEFVAGFIPPDYLVKKLITKAFLYSLTGQTGAGKTSITLRLAATAALGRSFGGLGTKPCRVLYLAAENPVDIQMRWIALGAEMEFDVATIGVFFVKGGFKIAATMKELRAEALRVGGEFGLIVVDTGPVFFEGEDENDRVAMRKHARMMRELIEVIPGKPTVIVNVHPTKNAGSDNLLPSGGGSFLNEVDGNLTAAKNEDQTIELSWQGKWRGVEFAPLHFLLKTATHPRLIDSDGEKMPTVVCAHLTMSDKEVMERAEFADQDKLLAEMARRPQSSLADLASHMSWRYAGGKPDRSKVQRYVKTLTKQKQVKKHLQSWIVTGAVKSKLNGGEAPTVSVVSIQHDTIDTKEH